MPQAAPRFCTRCRSAHPAGIECPAARAARLADIDRQRLGPRQRGYDSTWEKARAAFLQAHPSCVVCGQPATDVHHSAPHRGNQAVFWDRSQWAPLCHAHHSSATMREVNSRRRRGSIVSSNARAIACIRLNSLSLATSELLFDNICMPCLTGRIGTQWMCDG